MLMWKRRIGVLALITPVGACVADFDEMTVETVDQHDEAMAIDVMYPRWRVRLPNPIDPGWRLLRCLPDPRKTYVAHDPDACAGIRFFCAAGSEPFFDRCGCGCIVDSFGG